MILEQFIGDIGRRAIKEKNYTFSTIFIPKLREHVKSHKTEREYNDDIFRVFYEVLFEFLKEDEPGQKSFMWSVFPEEWTITNSNLDNKNFSRISLSIILRWIQSRIRDKLLTDIQLSDVLEHIFPELEPATWARILIFLLSPYSSDHRVESVLAIQRVFYTDAYPAILSFPEDDRVKKLELQRQDQEIKRTNAYEFALRIFPNIFTNENLKKWIREANSLSGKYEVGSIAERNRREFLEIFQDLKKLV